MTSAMALGFRNFEASNTAMLMLRTAILVLLNMVPPFVGRQNPRHLWRWNNMPKHDFKMQLLIFKNRHCIAQFKYAAILLVLMILEVWPALFCLSCPISFHC